jgi:phosphoserine phosphatase
MTCSAIICDWNGTLYEDLDEESILRAIAFDVAKSYLPWHSFKLVRLLKTKRELEILNNMRSHNVESDRVNEIFQVYNEKVIKGVPVSLVHRSVQKYSRRPEVQDKLVHRALRPIAELHLEGVATGILSAGYGYGIRMILKYAGYNHCFDFYEANPLAESTGKAVGFALNIYRNKAEVLLRLLKEKNLDAATAAYVGDSLDDTGCFEAVGHPIVSFLSPAGLKEQFTRKFGAFIPKDEADLSRYLRSI